MKNLINRFKADRALHFAIPLIVYYIMNFLLIKKNIFCPKIVLK